MSTEEASITPPVAAQALPPETRLAASRLALRTAMLPEPVVASPSTGRPLIDKLGPLSTPVASVLSHPVVSTVRDTVEQWWRNHPWRPVLTVAAEAAKQTMVPMARQHPGRVLGVALLAGAVLSRWRPWKWLLASTVPALLASMLPTLLSKAATRIPLSTLLKLVGATVSRGRNVPASSTPRAVVVAPTPSSTMPVAGANR